MLCLAVRELEDPRKLLDQAVTDMQADLVKMRQASAQVFWSCSCCYCYALHAVSTSILFYFAKDMSKCACFWSCYLHVNEESALKFLAILLYLGYLLFIVELHHAWVLQVIATQRLMQERQRSAASTADEWQRRAEMALRAGDEDLARAALTRRKSYQARHQHIMLRGLFLLQDLVSASYARVIWPVTRRSK